ncbi:phospholipase D family protein [Myxococcota bacterium]|nr:phospholipase D family protein [Myxococcota bacterium]
MTETFSWLSTSFARNTTALGRLSTEAVLNLASSAQRITVVSAFYDADFLHSIAKAVPKERRARVQLRVYLNAFSGQRRDQDAEVLRALERRWTSMKPGFLDAQIRVIRRTGLFHSKLLVFERGKAHTALVGSANATTAAYAHNEELMLQITGGSLPTSVSEYLSVLEKHGKELTDRTERAARSVAEFLRDGTLYFKPNTIAQFRFDLRLPRRTRAVLTRSAVKIEGMRPRLAGLTYDPVAGLEGLESAGERGRLLLRPEAIQTCYGWWVPEAYRQTVEAKIEQASRKRRRKVEGLADAVLRGIKNGEILANAQKRFRALKTLVDDQGLEDPESLRSRLDRFDRHVERMKAKVQNEQWRRRASCAYAAAVMPEIWDDPVASGEFLDSYFEYVEYVNSTRSVPKVVRSLQDAAGFAQGATESEVHSALADFLERHGWEHNRWQE